MAGGIVPGQSRNKPLATPANESFCIRESLRKGEGVIRANESSTARVVDVVLGAPMGDKTVFIFDPFINDPTKIYSVDKPLTTAEMFLLKEKIDHIKDDFENLTYGSILPREKMELAKAVYIYNHILKTVAYDEVEFYEGGGGSIHRKDNSRNSSAYGTLLKGVAVCSGISDAVYLLAAAMGLECKKVLTSGGEHAFNVIKVGGRWYSLDATDEINRYAGGKIASGKFKSDHFLRQASVPRPKNGTVAGLEVFSTHTDMPRERITETVAYLGKRGLCFNYGAERPKYFTDPARGIRAFAEANNIPTSREMIENLLNEININPSFKITKGNKPHIELRDGHLIVEQGKKTVELVPNSKSKHGIAILKTNGTNRQASLVNQQGKAFDRKEFEKSMKRIKNLLK